MTISELIERFRVKGYTKRAAKIILRDFADIINEALADGETVPIYGVGSFSVRRAGVKRFHDVQSGEVKVAPEHYAPKFLAAPRLRKTCRQGYVDGD